jgi:predicted nucleic acid-binding protein
MTARRTSATWPSSSSAQYARLNVLTISPAHVLLAIDMQSRRQLSFWDSLILVGAKAAVARLLLSEDQAHGRVYDGVRVENPFVIHGPATAK